MKTRTLVHRIWPVAAVLAFAMASTAVAVGGADAHHGDTDLAQAVVTMTVVPAPPLSGETE